MNEKLLDLIDRALSLDTLTLALLALITIPVAISVIVWRLT